MWRSSLKQKKKALVDGDSSQKKAPTLAGWGSWAGNGAPTEKSFSRRKNKKTKRKRELLKLLQKQNEMQERTKG